jgi:hypothetical protein
MGSCAPGTGWATGPPERVARVVEMGRRRARGRHDRKARGQKSLDFTVTLGSATRTLTSTDEERNLGRVRARCAEMGAVLRG